MAQVPTSDNARSNNTGLSVFCYVRWKAALFGSMLAGIGLLAVWVGVEALSPAWTAEVADGQLLVASPWWVRGPFMIVTGLVMLAPGMWQLFAALTGATVVQCDDLAIVARTSFGRMRRLAWRDIASVKHQQNQIILSPKGAPSLGQEIWDRTSVLLDTGMLDAAPGAIEAVLARHRPDLSLRRID